MAQTIIADTPQKYSCRLTLVDAPVGEKLWLTSFVPQHSGSPYDSKEPIFIRQNARPALLSADELPVFVNGRILAIRGYNPKGEILEARLASAPDLKATIYSLFMQPQIAYIHLHFAAYGCFACLIERAT